MALSKITNLSITDDAVRTVGIQDDNVTLAKLGDGTQGDILYYGASGAPARLGFGTSGDFLKTQGTGANPVWATAGGGKVLQVVEGTHTSDDYVTSTSYSTLFTQAITPAATSSKVLVIATIQWNLYGNGSSSFPSGYAQLLDNGDAEIAIATANASGNVSTDQTDQWNSSLSLVCLDSPSTTSAHSYKIAYKAGGSGRFGILGANNGTRLTLIEIGA